MKISTRCARSLGGRGRATTRRDGLPPQRTPGFGNRAGADQIRHTEGVPGGGQFPATNSGQGIKAQNVPAQLSLWSVGAAVILALFARPLRSFLPDIRWFSPYLWIPMCGVASILFGVIGLTRVKNTGVGKVEATIGLILGVGITLLSVAVILFVWEWSRSNLTF